MLAKSLQPIFFAKQHHLEAKLLQVTAKRLPRRLQGLSSLAQLYSLQMLPWMLDLFQRPVPATAARNSSQRDPPLEIEKANGPSRAMMRVLPSRKLQTQCSRRCRRHFQGASTSGSGAGVVCEQPVKTLRAHFSPVHALLKEYSLQAMSGLSTEFCSSSAASPPKQTLPALGFGQLSQLSKTETHTGSQAPHRRPVRGGLACLCTDVRIEDPTEISCRWHLQLARRFIGFDAAQLGVLAAPGPCQDVAL